MTRALYTMMVCVIVMLAVPVSQLQLDPTRIECCCPDEQQCKCPDHDEDMPGHATMKACHKTSTILASATAPVLSLPDEVAAAEPAERVTDVAFTASEPHEPPSPDRPRGPS